MVQIAGKYSHLKNENMDEYYKATGIQFLFGKMLASSSPSLEVKNDNDDWTIILSALMKTITLNFKLGEEFEEKIPGGIMKNTTILDGDKLITRSVGPNDTKLIRTYEFSDTGCVIIFRHEASGVEGRRYYKRD